jgi:Tic22-like family
MNVYALFIFLAIWKVHSFHTSFPSHTIQSLHIRERRHFLSTAIQVPFIFFTQSTSVGAIESSEGSLLTAENVADLLRGIPTFTIVDPKGIPYVVVGEDAKITGYFFTTFGEADRILRLARSSAEKSLRRAKVDGQLEKEASNPWKSARISSVPLDFAVTLTTKSTQGAYFKVVPSEKDIYDTLQIIGKSEIAEGKVPLFYFKDFVVVNQDGKQERRFYFQKSQLLQDWKARNKGVEPPKLQVTELFRVLTKMVEPGGTDQDLKDVVFVAPEDSKIKAKICNQVNELPFQLGQRIVVL